MILVADSGSTKTLWAQVGTRRRWEGSGLNPLLTSDARLGEELKEVSGHFRKGKESMKVYFYGAGCGQPMARERMRSALMEAMDTECVEVQTDMLGACRALCGHQSGVVGILGTGSNCCVYDGEKITFQPTSTGYILGDHGSANHVGRKLLHDYLTERMPYNIIPLFKEAFPMSKEQFLDAVYRQPNANRFLASLAPFALRNVRFTYCFFTVLNSLKEWYTHQLEDCLLQSQQRGFHLLGGYAAAIKSPMVRFQVDEKVELLSVVADPMKGLLAFHAEE